MKTQTSNLTKVFKLLSLVTCGVIISSLSLTAQNQRFKLNSNYTVKNSVELIEKTENSITIKF